METGHFAELAELESHYWWHVAKRQLVAGILQREYPPPGRLVEGGVGTAGNLLAFRDLGYTVAGLDCAPESIEIARSRGVTEIQQHDLSQPWPVPAGSLDIVVLLDVLEHLAEPVAALRHAANALRPGGGIVLTVPAYPFLFGQWDRRLGHYRRYTVPVLRSQAVAAGLRVRWVAHWNSFTLPAAVVSRTLDRLLRRDRPPVFPRVAPGWNAALLACARAERWVLRRVALPLGLSLVGVLSK